MFACFAVLLIVLFAGGRSIVRTGGPEMTTVLAWVGMTVCVCLILYLVRAVNEWVRATHTQSRELGYSLRNHSALIRQASGGSRPDGRRRMLELWLELWNGPATERLSRASARESHSVSGGTCGWCGCCSSCPVSCLVRSS